MNLHPIYLPERGDATTEADWSTLGGSVTGEAPIPAEARRLLVYRDGRPVARAAFGARTDFAGATGVTGYVGWYATQDAAAGARVLREAADTLLQRGARRVVGPLDGNSWRRYRVMMPRADDLAGGEPFLTEPVNPPDWPEHFAAAGFSPLLEYESRLVRRPAPDPGLEPHRAKLAASGVVLRGIEMGEYARELRSLYDLSLDAFAENPFYSPISFAEFQGMYEGIRPLLDPALVRLAVSAEGSVRGYAFAFTDPQARPQSPRIILKTLAVHSEARAMGLGALLLDDVHRIAHERGAAVLHALMQASNVSRNMSGRTGSELFRRYLLYAREAE